MELFASVMSVINKESNFIWKYLCKKEERKKKTIIIYIYIYKKFSRFWLVF